MVSRLYIVLLDGAASSGVLALVLLVLSQVVSRELFSSSLAWSEEVAAYVMIWTGLIGTASHLRTGRFMALTLFDTSSRTVMMITRALAGVVTIGFLGIVFWAGLKLSLLAETATRSPAARVPMSIVYLIFPVASALIAIGYLAACFRLPAQQSGEDGGC